MGSEFKKVNEFLYRLDIPFDHLYTTVFLVLGETPVIIDSATTYDDVQERILPALFSMGIDEGKLLVTHRHGDHNGGTPYLLAALPRLRPLHLANGESFASLKAYALPGHTEDSMGYLDTRTSTLLCGDAFQFYGVGKYGCGICDAAAYEKTLLRAKELSPAAILPSHDFVGGSAFAEGKEEVDAFLSSAHEKWEEICTFVRTFPCGGDPFAVVRAWKAAFPMLPPLPSMTVKAIWAHTSL